MGTGLFGEPGTFGETENKRIFGHMRQTMARVASNIELLALEQKIENMQKYFEKGHCTFAEVDRLIEISSKLWAKKLEGLESELAK